MKYLLLSLLLCVSVEAQDTLKFDPTPDTCTRARLDTEYWSEVFDTLPYNPYIRCYNRIPGRWEVRVDTVWGCEDDDCTPYRNPVNDSLTAPYFWYKWICTCTRTGNSEVWDWIEDAKMRIDTTYEPLQVPYLTEEQIKKLKEVLED